MATDLKSRAIAAAEVDVAAADWEAAIRAATALLVRHAAATVDYADSCVNLVRRHGPYIVVAPGIALAHARPEDGALGLAVAVARLHRPVRFGHPSNDPVDLVFAFASPNHDAHVGLLAALAKRLANGLGDALRCAATNEAATALLQGVIDDAG